MRATRRYGWKPDPFDQRDLLFAAAMPTSLPSSINMQSVLPGAYDQLNLNSCTANAIAGAMQFIAQQFMPSRLFIYYSERARLGTINEDSGSTLRAGIKAVNSLGACSESLWPYDPSQYAVQPTQACYTNAILDEALTYQRLQGLNQFKSVLAGGLPFVFGFYAYESLESDAVAASGVLNMPQPGEELLGGHAGLVMGFDDNTQRFLVRNSWGNSWGMNGYFTIPYAYLTNPNLSGDFWVIQTIGEGVVSDQIKKSIKLKRKQRQKRLAGKTKTTGDGLVIYGELKAWYKQQKVNYTCFQCGVKNLTLKFTQNGQKFNFHQAWKAGYTKAQIIEKLNNSQCICQSCTLKRN